MSGEELTDHDYQALSNLRHTLRHFTAFSRDRVTEAGLTPQQHQALLAIRALPPGDASTGYVAERLVLQPHSATGLVNRMVAAGLIERHRSSEDARRSVLCLTPHAETLLARLSEVHRDEIRRLRPLLMAILREIG